MTKTLFLRGHAIPNKKDRLRPGRPGQKMHYESEDKDLLWLIIWTLQGQWAAIKHKAPPFGLEHPEIRITLHVRNKRGDRDGKVATLMDAMVQAGILRNDNIARCNGRIVIEPAEVRPEEGAEIEISWEGE